MEKVIRVFPRRTSATPTDEYAFVGNPPLWWPDADEVHVSVTFTWDLQEAEHLADAWAVTGLPVRIGGPATGQRGADFVPGRYLQPGYTITSRGCPNNCWFCSAWKREGDLRELAITEGWNVADDNLLACSREHIEAVFAMLRRQSHPITFSGGLEAARLQDWHIDELRTLRSPRMYFAYDTADDLPPLRDAGRRLLEAGCGATGHRLACYVLIGYPGDHFARAENRLRDTFAAGFFPFAMLYRDHSGKRAAEWIPFQRKWARPQSTAVLLAEQEAVSAW